MTNQDILSQGIMPHSRAVLSSRSRVYGVGAKGSGEVDELIGTISSFGISSNRNIEPIRGIGIGDHIVEMVPGQSDPVELTITKFAMSLANTFQEFGYMGGVDGFVRALKHHRYPIDIKHEILISSIANGADTRLASAGDYLGDKPTQSAPSSVDGTGGYKGSDNLNDYQAIVTWFEGCWFSSYSITYPVDTAAITEDSTLMVTDVSGHKLGEIILPYNRDAFKDNSSRIWKA